MNFTKFVIIIFITCTQEITSSDNEWTSFNQLTIRAILSRELLILITMRTCTYMYVYTCSVTSMYITSTNLEYSNMYYYVS